MKAIEKLENRQKSGLQNLFGFSTDMVLVEESLVISAMSFLNMKYWGAIDSDDQEQLFDSFGISFTPSRNNGENMWLMTRHF